MTFTLPEAASSHWAGVPDPDEAAPIAIIADVGAYAPTTASAFGHWLANGHVVPAARRAAVSRQSGWIAPVVVAGGVVCGTWELDGDWLRVAWFSEAGRRPRNALEAEAARLSSILDRELRAAISVA